jgi:peptide/nickel transport system permease protein
VALDVVDTPPDTAEVGAWSSFSAWARLILGSLEGKLGVVILGIFLVIVVFGPTIAPYGPSAIGVAPSSSGPSLHHLLGGDNLGRDVFSRLLYGARSVIGVPLLATLVAFATGGLAGMIAGFLGGTTDTVISRVTDVLLSLPPLLVVLVIIAAVGASTPILVCSVAAVFAPRVARILRGATQGAASSEYVEAAHARGERTFAIVLREILPNILPTVFVEFAVRLTFAIIFMATINFLGLGFQPPSPNWGVMVSEQRATISLAPLSTLAPALAIGIVSIGVSLIADAATQALGLDRFSTTR